MLDYRPKASKLAKDADMGPESTGWESCLSSHKWFVKCHTRRSCSLKGLQVIVEESSCLGLTRDRAEWNGDYACNLFTVTVARNLLDVIC